MIIVMEYGPDARIMLSTPEGEDAPPSAETVVWFIEPGDYWTPAWPLRSSIRGLYPKGVLALLDMIAGTAGIWGEIRSEHNLLIVNCERPLTEDDIVAIRRAVEGQGDSLQAIPQTS